MTDPTQDFLDGDYTEIEPVYTGGVTMLVAGKPADTYQAEYDEYIIEQMIKTIESKGYTVTKNES